MRTFDLIIDGFTDEHSGYGVPPFVNTHPRYLAGALAQMGHEWEYVTIDDVRFASRVPRPSALETSRDKSLRNTSRNRDRTSLLLSQAATVYVIAGRFVDYEYASAIPVSPDELAALLSPYPARKVLVYVISTQHERGPDVLQSFDRNVFAHATTLPAHEYVLGHPVAYSELAAISVIGAAVLSRLSNDFIVELETAHGCNWKPGCTFCIEAARKDSPVYRPVADIHAEVRACYAHGARHFRLGRQPNLFNYMGGDPAQMELLLSGIREICPELLTLHIDNTSPQDIITSTGRAIASHIARFCTSGNIGSFGVESFDPEVRERNRLNSNPADILEAIAIFNEVGAQRGETGLPALLPGLNLIHGLPGQRPETLTHNLRCLTEILDRGFMTRRTFVRGLTDPTGFLNEASSRYRRLEESLDHWQAEIEREFALPMLKRVVPNGTILRGARAEFWTKTGTLFRQIGTCPIRIHVEGKFIPVNTRADVRVDVHVNGRTVLGSPV